MILIIFHILKIQVVKPCKGEVVFKDFENFEGHIFEKITQVLMFEKSNKMIVLSSLL